MIAAVGGRGTGKSAWVRQLLEKEKPPRLVVWDLVGEHDWAGPAAITPEQWGAAIKSMAARRFVVRIQPPGDDERRATLFDAVCRACRNARDMTLYAEELAFVTRPSSAPPGWRELCLLGRHAGVSIIGTSQRPAQVDKEFWGNLDLIHAGRQTSERDARTMGSLLGVPWQDLQRLPDLHWLERTPADMAARSGVLTFSAAQKVKKSRAKVAAEPEA